MHLVEGTLESSTVLFTSAAGLLAFGVACYGARREMSARHLPSLVAMTGFVFAAQMVNCATGFGFSGHLVGAALLAILFGPCAAMLSMAVVLSAQVAFMGDGSWSTLGANFMNMGVVAPWLAYGVFRMLQGRRSPQLDAAQCAALTLASYASILGAAVSLSFMAELPLRSMLSSHALIGVIEAVLGVGVFSVCVRGVRARVGMARQYALKPIVAVCLLALCVLPWSSKQPDGFEHVSSTAVRSGE